MRIKTAVVDLSVKHNIKMSYNIYYVKLIDIIIKFQINTPPHCQPSVKRIEITMLLKSGISL